MSLPGFLIAMAVPERASLENKGFNLDARISDREIVLCGGHS
jgi:hypothetical protein